MLIKLAALGTLGFLGYKYLARENASVAPAPQAAPDVRLAGGPLSSEARLQHTPDAPPPPRGAD